MALALGLLHGFGFSSVLADVGLPRDRLLSGLVGFNLGVELGQLALVALFVPLRLSRPRHRRLSPAGAGGWLAGHRRSGRRGSPSGRSACRSSAEENHEKRVVPAPGVSARAGLAALRRRGRRPPSVPSRQHRPPPASCRWFERLAAEQAARFPRHRPARRDRAGALAARGLVVERWKQVLASPVGARYCMAGSTQLGVGVAVVRIRPPQRRQRRPRPLPRRVRPPDPRPPAAGARDHAADAHPRRRRRSPPQARFTRLATCDSPTNETLTQNTQKKETDNDTA
jgi:hypothetical protein